MDERKMLVDRICIEIRNSGINPDSYMEIRDRLKATSLDVLRRIAGTNAVSEAVAGAKAVLA